jgi:hypothetical protein
MRKALEELGTAICQVLFMVTVLLLLSALGEVLTEIRDDLKAIRETVVEVKP